MLANEQGQTRAKTNTMTDCIGADAMVVHARVDAMGEFAIGNLQREICDRAICNEESARKIYGGRIQSRWLHLVDLTRLRLAKPSLLAITLFPYREFSWLRVGQ